MYLICYWFRGKEIFPSVLISNGKYKILLANLFTTCRHIICHLANHVFCNNHSFENTTSFNSVLPFQNQDDFMLCSSEFPVPSKENYKIFKVKLIRWHCEVYLCLNEHGRAGQIAQRIPRITPTNVKRKADDVSEWVGLQQILWLDCGAKKVLTAD